LIKIANYFMDMEDNQVKNYCLFNQSTVNMYFINTFIKTLNCLNEKLDNLEHVIIGSNVMCHVFWIILSYTNNLEYTLTQAEKSVLLFSEFILMSQDPNINKDLHFIPEMTDAINFSYKKCIGNISFAKLKRNKKFSFNSNCIILIKHIVINLFKNNQNISQDKIIEMVIPINKITKLINNNEIFNMLNDIITERKFTETKQITDILNKLIKLRNQDVILVQKFILNQSFNKN
jgi:hypothetical protein